MRAKRKSWRVGVEIDGVPRWYANVTASSVEKAFEAISLADIPHERYPALLQEGIIHPAEQHLVGE